MRIEPHRRLSPNNNLDQIDEAARLFVPGVKHFDADGLNRWLQENASRDINIDLLFHKYPRWFKRQQQKSPILLKPFKKNNRRSEDPGDYCQQHLKDICALSSEEPSDYHFLKQRYFWDMSYSFTLKTASRLLVGFSGGDHVFETSLTLHPLYGFPVIPGSSLKGVALHYCRDIGVSPDERMAIFGKDPDSKDPEDPQGEVVCMDAWPEQWPAGDKDPILELDVMTPHYHKYYGNPKHPPPSDDQQPNPVLFLAVAANVEFRFCLRPSRICRNPKIVEKALAHLRVALREHGVGAKTGSSYGYFK